MANLLLFLVFAGLTAGVIVMVFIVATRGKRGPQPQTIVRRSGPNTDNFMPTTPSSPTFTPSSSGDDTSLNPGGGSFGGGGADASWTDNAASASDAGASDSSASDSGSSDSSSSDSGGGDSGGSSDSSS